MIVLSHFQTAPLLTARHNNLAVVTTSTDLGLTAAEVKLESDGVSFPAGERLTWAQVEEIQANETICICIEDNTPRPVRAFSEMLGRVYSLMPTESAPTMLVSGIPMHRIKDTDPSRDTLSKIKAVAPVGGQVLDTATGLGYTAIEAARTAVQVITIELDPAAQEIARLNPWSQALFHNPKITQIIGDSFDEIARFNDKTFSCIIHDPPTFSLAGDLYSGEYYRQAFRVLKRNGKLFHYIGDPQSRSGARVTKGVIRRLQEAGFRQVVPQPQAFGVAAYK